MNMFSDFEVCIYKIVSTTDNDKDAGLSSLLMKDTGYLAAILFVLFIKKHCALNIF
jgi:hypothetical protein